MKHSLLTLALSLAGLAALTGCPEEKKPGTSPTATAKPTATASSTGKAAPSASGTASGQADTPTVKALMADHFTKATDLRKAVVDGKLDDGQAAAKALTSTKLGDDLPKAWKTNLEPFMAAAKKGAEAADLEALALATGELGAACGSCHKAMSGPTLEPGDPPAEGSGVEAHMARHQWAADRMWDGIIGPSPAAWSAGTDVWADEALTSKELAPSKTAPDEVKELGKKVHELGKKANAVTATEEQAQLFGEMLATCSSCHTKLKE